MSMRIAPGTILALVFLSGGLARAQTEGSRDTKLQAVINAAQVETIKARLQSQLDRIGGAHIKGCGPVLRLIAPQTSGLDETYGGSCTLDVGGNSLSALMCADSRGRQFALTLTPVSSVEAMRRFFVENCYPAG